MLKWPHRHAGIHEGRNGSRLFPPRSRFRFARRAGVKTALALLAAAFGLLFGTGAAQAQTTVDLVSNQLKSSDTFCPLEGEDCAQRFTTGSNTDGYKLTGVTLTFSVPSTGTAIFTVSIHSDASNSPGSTNLGTLTTPSLTTPGDQQLEFKASGSGIDLAANTKYWVVLDSSTNDPGFRYWTTNSDDEDSGAAAGWSIENSLLFRNKSSTNGWQTHDSANKIAIRGHAVDTPPTLSRAVQDGKTLTLTFDKALNASLPGGAAFAVKLDGMTQNLAGTTPVAISGSTVTLTLASAPGAGALTVDYTEPMTGTKLTGTNGYQVASFTGQTVMRTPTVTGVAITSDPGADRIYQRGDVIRVTVTFSAPVTVDRTNGTPRLILHFQGGDGAPPAQRNKQAMYESGSGSNKLVFAYTVQAADDSGTQGVGLPRNRLELNNGTIKAGTTDATLTYAAVGHDTNHRVHGPTAQDTTGPAVSGAPTVNGASLVITFNEALDATGTAPAASAFTVKVANANRGVSTVEISGSAVTLTLAAAVIDADVVTVAYTQPAADPIQDFTTGNDAPSFGDTNVTNNTPGVAPSFSSATVSGTTLTITFDEPLDPNATPAASAFTVIVANANRGVSTVEISGPRVTLTLASAAVFGETVTVSYDPSQAGTGQGIGPLQDRAATPNLVATFTGQDVTNNDNTPPEFESAAVAGTRLTLTFDEPLDPMATPAPGAFFVRVRPGASGAFVRRHVANGGVAINDATVILTLTQAVARGHTVTVRYTKPTGGTNNKLQDGAMNEVATFGNQNVTNATPPGLVRATVNRAVLTLTFNDALAVASALANTAFEVKRTPAGGSEETLGLSGSPNINGATVTLTLQSAVAEGDAVTVRYTRPATGSNNRLQDAANYEVASFSMPAENLTDTTPPSVSSEPAVNGRTLTITFNEDLDPDSTPEPAAFTVTVGDGEGAPPTTVKVSDATVTLTLASAVSPGQDVTISYNQSQAGAGTGEGIGPLQDAAGNTVVNITDQPVRNQTPRPTPSSSTSSTPSATVQPAQATVTGATVTLTFDAPLDENAKPDPADFTVTLRHTPASSGTLTRRAATAQPAQETPTYRVTDVAIDGADLILTIAPSVPPGAEVAVAYTPGATPLQQADGTPVPKFGTQEVENLTPPGEPPVANAGKDRTVFVDTRVRLDGSGTDPDGDDAALTFAWRQTAGEPVSLRNATTKTPTFTAPADPGFVTFRLTVTDPGGLSHADEVTLTVKPQAAPRKRLLTRTLAVMGAQTLSHALDTLGARFTDASPATSLTVGGQPVTFGDTGATPERRGQPCPDGSLPPDGAPSPADGLACDEDARRAPPAPSPSLGQILQASSFTLALGADGPAGRPRWTLWGRGGAGAFAGQPEPGSHFSGQTKTGWLGVDARAGAWVAGLAVSYDRTEADYSFTSDGTQERGDLETTLTTLYPYGRWALSETLDIQTLLGAGRGTARHRLATGEASEQSDLALWLGSLGLRQQLPPVAGFTLAARADASLVQLDTDDGDQAIDGLTARSWRGRLGLDATQSFLLDDGTTLAPFVTLVGRYDGGDGFVGAGLEVAGGVRYTADRVQVEARGRILAVHAQTGAQERGFSVTARFSPEMNGEGLSLALAPRWGAATGDATALWQHTLPQNTGIPGTEVAALEAQVGYGLALFDTGVVTPYAGTMLAEGADRTYRLGTRVQVPGRGAPGLTLNVEGTRQEPAGGQPVNQGLRLDLSWGF